MRTIRILATTAVAASLLLSGCASQADSSPTATPLPGETEELGGTLTVFAAASLKAAFDTIAEEFEQANPGVDILPIVYDGSSTLATQLIEGAPVDVFASADEANMKKVTDAGLATGAELFATNTLVVVVPTGNPGEVEDLSDLGDDSVTVVLCAPEVPCGAASRTLLDDAGVVVTPASLEQNVTAVLTKVAADEADAGLVYATDVRSRDDVESFVPEGAADVVNRYPLVALADSANPDAAAAFVAFVRGPEGQAILQDLGFGAP
ncbi:molybdate ABC transporter substrate-binding protein [Microbacterium ulmi]|uniref:Molybdate ABC transporter substrate-binding protein n=1 Tax=Microbacterium ulmi TaxID=179095 RepID=A0A7Y2M1P5_9MICO|nr:molybdate ABC transporter substrate-binding protein [Microbacterium ulmi]NII68644.1 molybdate transport system substrate-binding protein [Microbacterium ulmi]NNH04814.1 molybdate ABC transporter substrate-binding protein [Microbacterium ulmi]